PRAASRSEQCAIIARQLPRSSIAFPKNRFALHPIAAQADLLCAFGQVVGNEGENRQSDYEYDEVGHKFLLVRAATGQRAVVLLFSPAVALILVAVLLFFTLAPENRLRHGSSVAARGSREKISATILRA
ncbi:MAG TPA: hypothetical protein VEE84_03120, partial [Burkholderiaceae bacterium]|nr:hypothetical protein [Burkholderiaceae bacterium]